jgi:hypothetical protein
MAIFLVVQSDNSTPLGLVPAGFRHVACDVLPDDRAGN